MLIKIFSISFRHLTQDGIDIISESGQIQDVNNLSKRALDVSRQIYLPCPKHICFLGCIHRIQKVLKIFFLSV